MNGTNCDLANAIPLTNYLQNTLTVCMVTTPVHDLSKNNLIEHPLLKNIVVVDEQSSVAYHTAQPASVNCDGVVASQKSLIIFWCNFEEGGKGGNVAFADLSWLSFSNCESTVGMSLIPLSEHVAF